MDSLWNFSDGLCPPLLLSRTFVSDSVLASVSLPDYTSAADLKATFIAWFIMNFSPGLLPHKFLSRSSKVCQAKKSQEWRPFAGTSRGEDLLTYLRLLQQSQRRVIRGKLNGKNILIRPARTQGISNWPVKYFPWCLWVWKRSLKNIFASLNLFASGLCIRRQLQNYFQANAYFRYSILFLWLQPRCLPFLTWVILFYWLFS